MESFDECECVWCLFLQLEGCDNFMSGKCGEQPSKVQ